MTDKKEIIHVEEQKRAQTVGLTELMRVQVQEMINSKNLDLTKKYKTAFMDGFHLGFKSGSKGSDYEDE